MFLSFYRNKLPCFASLSLLSFTKGPLSLSWRTDLRMPVPHVEDPLLVEMNFRFPRRPPIVLHATLGSPRSVEPKLLPCA